jgi:hypothetical protein
MSLPSSRKRPESFHPKEHASPFSDKNDQNPIRRQTVTPTKIDHFQPMDMEEEDFARIDRFVSQKALLEPAISAQNLFSVYQCPDQQMYRARVQFLFSLDGLVYDEETREALIDMVHGAILFASDNDFPYPKAIVFLSLYIAVFKAAVASPYYRPYELHRKYEQMLLSHSHDRPPFASLIFDLSDVKIINDFFINTFFRNLKLILACFSAKQVMVFKAEFPIQVSPLRLPKLADMELVPSEPAAEEEEEAGAVEEEEGPEPPDAFSPQAKLEEMKAALTELHERFVEEFEAKERWLCGKMAELEIRLKERARLRTGQ